MAKMLYDEGNVIYHKLAAAASYGDIIAIDGLGGIALDAGGIGDTISVRISGGIYSEKADGAAEFLAGDVLYYDTVGKKLVNANQGDALPRIGVCIAPKSAAATVAQFRLG